MFLQIQGIWHRMLELIAEEVAKNFYVCHPWRKETVKTKKNKIMYYILYAPKRDPDELKERSRVLLNKSRHHYVWAIDERVISDMKKYQNIAKENSLSLTELCL